MGGRITCRAPVSGTRSREMLPVSGEACFGVPYDPEAGNAGCCAEGLCAGMPT